MEIKSEVTIKLNGLKKFRSDVKKQLQSGTSGPIRAAFKQWGLRFRTFIQKRYIRLSQGGGSWPPLKHKRRRGAKEHTLILRDTGILLRAVSPAFKNLPGQYEAPISGGIEVGFGGPHKHGSGGAATIADIASFHHTGAGNLPVRKIIVAPDAQTIGSMASDMERALLKLSDDTIGAS